MKRYVLLFCLIAVLAFAADSSWRANYEKGLELIGQSRYQEAIPFLKMAVADKPVSEIVRNNGTTVLEYLPYLQLGICYHRLGKNELASEYLELENSFAAIGHSQDGKKLMSSYQKELQKVEGQFSRKEMEGIRNFQRKPYVLSDLELAALKEEVRRRCHLPKTDDRGFPWYYHYEVGLSLGKKSDWQRALDSFLAALDHRARPKRFSRLYGVWFIDYFPYYHIGEAHYRLQNWSCAIASFRLSEQLEDIPRDAGEFKNLEQYKTASERNVTN